MLIASAMLLIPTPVIFYLQRLKTVDLNNDDVHADLSAAKIGGNPLAGFKTFFTNPYLLAIGAFMSVFSPDPTFEQNIKLVEEAKEIQSEEDEKGEPRSGNE